MSRRILGGRLAGQEGAYFFEESKQAISKLANKLPTSTNNPPIQHQPDLNSVGDGDGDVLPQVLQHSLPPILFRTQPQPQQQCLSNPKWALSGSGSGLESKGLSRDVINPLSGFVSIPQLTFGPKRWQLPAAASSITASTANDLREHSVHVNPDKVRAAAQGLVHIGKAFAIATVIIFGSSAIVFGFAASKLDLHSSDDIRTKGKGLVQPKFESLKEQLAPLKNWAENTSKKWHLKNEQDIKERPIIKELSKILRIKDST